MEPQITIPLSEYNRLVESDRQLKDKTRSVLRDRGPYNYQSSWVDIFSNEETVDKVIRINKSLSWEIEKLYEEKKALEEKLSERGIFHKLFG